MSGYTGVVIRLHFPKKLGHPRKKTRQFSLLQGGSRETNSAFHSERPEHFCWPRGFEMNGKICVCSGGIVVNETSCGTPERRVCLFKMVEAAGIEPASEDLQPGDSTCLSGSVCQQPVEEPTDHWCLFLESFAPCGEDIRGN